LARLDRQFDTPPDLFAHLPAFLPIQLELHFHEMSVLPHGVP
jgi:hypothetical protein